MQQELANLPNESSQTSLMQEICTGSRQCKWQIVRWFQGTALKIKRFYTDEGLVKNLFLSIFSTYNYL